MKKQLSPWIATIVVAILLFVIVNYWLQAYYQADQLMVEHISLITQKLNQIHKDCIISSFDHNHNYIDFLNVITFHGSEVGPLNLVYPQNWQGPYLKDNPMMQEKYYQVVHVQDGYFVVPGSGVKLGNGLIIGQDIVFTLETDMNVLMKEDKLFTKQGKSLAQQILK